MISFVNCRMSTRGSDVETSLTLTFMEAVNGCTKDIRVQVLTTCDTCEGTGSADKSKSKPSACPSCDGTGQQQTRDGFFVVNMTCRKCRGTGTIIKNPCKKCSGNGVAPETKTVSVSVPAGVDGGINMRLANQGNAGKRGGPSGHLFVGLHVLPDPFFQRDGVDLHVTVPVTLSQAVLGTTLTVPTIKGEVELKVPAGTQPNDKLVMRGRGVPRLNGGATGNQYVSLNIEIPKRLTAKQEALMKEFAEEEARAPSSGFAFFKDTLDRIRKMVKGTA
jgi:molecular chaperone DnaJ